MAGDWIKMRSNLWDDPRIARLCDLTGAREASVIGALFWLWTTADQHTEDGVMHGLTLKSIDRKTGLEGFADALCTIEWLAEHANGVRIIDFAVHNGTSAKKRADTAKRVALHRVGNAESVTKSVQKRTSALAREEKRREREREEKKNKGEGGEGGGTARATRLPTDQVLSDQWFDFCKTERPDLDPTSTFENFRDYWTAKPGQDANKLNWFATWRNWVRSQHRLPNGSKGQLLSFAEQDRIAGRKRWEEMTGRVHPDSERNIHAIVNVVDEFTAMLSK